MSCRSRHFEFMWLGGFARSLSTPKISYNCNPNNYTAGKDRPVSVAMLELDTATYLACHTYVAR